MGLFLDILATLALFGVMVGLFGLSVVVAYSLFDINRERKKDVRQN